MLLYSMNNYFEIGSNSIEGITASLSPIFFFNDSRRFFRPSGESPSAISKTNTAISNPILKEIDISFSFDTVPFVSFVIGLPLSRNPQVDFKDLFSICVPNSDLGLLNGESPYLIGVYERLIEASGQL